MFTLEFVTVIITVCWDNKALLIVLFVTFFSRWYHSNMTRAEAEEMLKRVHYDGAFLVRPSEKESNCFAISFR